MSAAILDAWYAGIREGMAEAIRTVATPDIRIWWNGPRDLVPWAGEHVGADAAIAFFAQIGANLSVLRTTVVERMESEGAIVVFLDAHWQLKRNGQDIRAKAVNVFRFRDGKVAAYEIYPDSAAFARALAM
jgi:uncharacterized protein